MLNEGVSSMVRRFVIQPPKYFGYTLPNMDLSAGHGWRIEYYMSGQFGKGSAAVQADARRAGPVRDDALSPCAGGRGILK